MFRTTVLTVALVSLASVLFGQIQAKAISYQVEIDLNVFAPDYADETETEDLICRFEVDTYFTAEQLRTVVRTNYTPSDFALTLRQRAYQLQSRDEINIDLTNESVIIRKNQKVDIKSTGKTKSIMGYSCKEYTFQDFRGIAFSVWVTDKLQKNVFPAGNFGLKGTVLEATTSNGVHYLATDMATGVLDNNFFEIPAGYEQEVVDLAPQKKSK